MKRTTFNVTEIAEYLGVSRDLIYTMVSKNEVPHVRLSSRILFKRESIDRWLEELEKRSVKI